MYIKLSIKPGIQHTNTEVESMVTTTCTTGLVELIKTIIHLFKNIFLYHFKILKMLLYLFVVKAGNYRSYYKTFQIVNVKLPTHSNVDLTNKSKLIIENKDIQALRYILI